MVFMSGRGHHQSVNHACRGLGRALAPTITAIAVLLVISVLSIAWAAGLRPSHQEHTAASTSMPTASRTTSPVLDHRTLNRTSAPAISTPSATPSSTPTSTSTSQSSATTTLTKAQARSKAVAAVNGMSMEERAGQLVMATLTVGSSPSTIRQLISDRHMGSVLLIGNWTIGTAGMRAVTDALQSYAPSGNSLLITTDEEGGSVQHLKGDGFDSIPSQVAQGGMTQTALRSSWARWGSQLAAAGVNVDLAPVVDTVTVLRSSNDAIGALNRDFGLDASGNGLHAAAAIRGLRHAGVRSAIKHFPGLGGVQGNTDFTASGVKDTSTTADGPEIGAFSTALSADPGMVMMYLATYSKLDGSSPAAFSSTIVDGLLRSTLGFDGVVTSDSLSATAVSGVPVDQLGVRLIEAGGDLACMGSPSYNEPVLNGIIAKARADSTFAARVKQSAVRVMTLKYLMGLAR